MAKGEKTQDRSAADHEEGPEAGDDAALQARLARLSDALENRRQHQSESSEADAETSRQSISAANLGFRALVEFVTAIVVAPLIGWQIDAWLKTGPIFLIIFLMLGMAGGLANVYRIAVRPTGRTGNPKL